MSKKHFIITGGLGFIGTNLVKKLEKKAKITIIDNSKSHNFHYYSFSKNVKIVNININSKKFSLNNYGKIDTVIHLAAYGSVVDSVDKPIKNFNNNVLSTLKILEECRINNIKKILFSSTGGALMGNSVPPVSENTLPRPISPYGASKLACEAYLSAYSESYKINTVILRFANIYGPYSWHKKGVITNFIKNIINEKKLNIYGSENSTRDYLYVDDLCYGIIKALKIKKKGCSIYHLSSGKETSLKNLVNIFKKITKNKKIKVKNFKSRRGEILKNFSINKLAKKELGFRVKNNLDNGLKKTLNWFFNFNR